jgi:hypothetical protein
MMGIHWLMIVSQQNIFSCCLQSTLTMLKQLSCREISMKISWFLSMCRINLSRISIQVNHTRKRNLLSQEVIIHHLLQFTGRNLRRSPIITYHHLHLIIPIFRETIHLMLLHIIQGLTSRDQTLDLHRHQGICQLNLCYQEVHIDHRHTYTFLLQCRKESLRDQSITFLYHHQ